MSSIGLNRKKNVKKGIQFCIMVAGISGTGRTTFLNTLCGQEVLTSAAAASFDPKEAHIDKGITIHPITVDLEEDGARISLTIVDTPGFGDNINNESCFSEIMGYLERQYDDILAEESRIKRNPRFRDNRVHVLLYFITPTGHGLRELDIELMKRLSSRVNIIPVIGKADSLTPTELAENKKLIMEDIYYYKIPIYDFPYEVEEDDEITIEENAELRAKLPFAIVASTEAFQINNRPTLARQYPWGYVEVDNPKHSDFGVLRSALLGTHLSDLKEITDDVLYERYRTERLSKGVETPLDGSLNAEELASQSFLLKEEKLRRDEQKLREIEQKVQQEITERRQQLLARENELRELEARFQREASLASHEDSTDSVIPSVSSLTDSSPTVA
ncbi:Septin-domain-containing protein [Lipomyces oligophaga]|uniref:Septin-domain-containing protein n=1 Tax=Lipomyces oligophaga TaxID=45792 RepID=UPI0034CFA185